MVELGQSMSSVQELLVNHMSLAELEQVLKVRSRSSEQEQQVNHRNPELEQVQEQEQNMQEQQVLEQELSKQEQQVLVQEQSRSSEQVQQVNHKNPGRQQELVQMVDYKIGLGQMVDYMKKKEQKTQQL